MSEFLLDTCSLIFALGADDKAKILRDIIASSQVYVSAINFWEIAIKTSKGKLSMSITLDDLIERCSKALAGVLPIEASDILDYKNLLDRSSHKDPFDLMLLAQAKSRKMLLITSDQILLSEFKRLTRPVKKN